jgi:antitoxin CcdA
MSIDNAHKECTMQVRLFDPDAPKKSANLSVNSDLLRRAKEERINLSQTLENGLAETLRTRKRQEWLASNREAIEEYIRFVEKHGVFSDTLRSF